MSRIIIRVEYIKGYRFCMKHGYSLFPFPLLFIVQLLSIKKVIRIQKHEIKVFYTISYADTPIVEH